MLWILSKRIKPVHKYTHTHTPYTNFCPNITEELQWREKKREKISVHLESWCWEILVYLEEAVGQFCEEWGGRFQFLRGLKIYSVVFLFLDSGC